MKLKLILYFLLTIPCFATAQSQKENNKQSPTLARPKLIVGIVVDQMRWDYLYRYYDRYQKDGFKRLLNEGFSCDNVHINYVPTLTAIGHSSIYTGSVPAIHGIVGNNFIIQPTGQSIYCTEDTTVQTVGSNSKAGLMSPRNLLASTLGDELKLATNFRSKVIGIALKDRGGILPGGHTANAAYWFDDDSGNWITSTYYMNSLPKWVNQFNAARHPEKYLKKDWNTLYPINSYLQSFPDNNPYEDELENTTSPTLPLKTSALYKNNFKIIRYTPYGNSLTLDMAREAIDNESLGKNKDTDLLAISLSSTDYIGHQFGINSIEIEDTYLRLDRDLASFFKYLDSKLGSGNYTLFLTADHGAAHNAQLLLDKNIPAGFFEGNQISKNLNSFLESKFGITPLVLSIGNNQVNLNKALINKKNLHEEDIVATSITFLQTQPGVAHAVNSEEITETTIPNLIRERLVNGYNPERSGQIQLILKPGWYHGFGTLGTTHANWNPNDSHIPLLFMGWGIKNGRSNKANYITDIAPTLSTLLHIQAPNGSIGNTIEEVLE